jgi:SNF2 family DNA or RNA helicase
MLKVGDIKKTIDDETVHNVYVKRLSIGFAEYDENRKTYTTKIETPLNTYIYYSMLNPSATSDTAPGAGTGIEPGTGTSTNSNRNPIFDKLTSLYRQNRTISYTNALLEIPNKFDESLFTEIFYALDEHNIGLVTTDDNVPVVLLDNIQGNVKVQQNEDDSIEVSAFLSATSVGELGVGGPDAGEPGVGKSIVLPKAAIISRVGETGLYCLVKTAPSQYTLMLGRLSDPEMLQNIEFKYLLQKENEVYKKENINYFLSGVLGKISKNVSLDRPTTFRTPKVQAPTITPIRQAPKYEIVTKELEINISTNDTESNDWFTININVKLDDEEIPLSTIIRAIAKQERFIPTESGKLIEIQSQPKLLQLAKMLKDADKVQLLPGEAKISKYNLVTVNELTDIATNVELSEKWKTNIKKLQNLDISTYNDKIVVPESITATLRDYQLVGFNWLNFLYKNKFGGVLADDMGLGKTLELIAMIAEAKRTGETRPFIIVAPASVTGNWKSEFSKFCPSLKIVVKKVSDKDDENFYTNEPSAGPSAGGPDVGEPSIEGPEVGADVGAKKYDVIIMSYAIFRLDFYQINSEEFAGVIFDESQMLKNPKSIISKAARNVNIDLKIAASGTPIENSLTELWAVYSIVSPGLFGTLKQFNKERLSSVKNKIKPFLLRRTKEEVARQLPEKVEQIVEIELSKEHKKVYDLYLSKVQKEVLGLSEDLLKNRMFILAQLTILRRMAIDPRLIDPDQYAEIVGEKLNYLNEMLEEILPSGNKVLIFSQYTSVLELVKQSLDKSLGTKVKYSYLDGKTQNREKVINEFKTGKNQVFLVSIKAGGFGLNLTEADYVFIMDPWWNPAVEEQAVDRTHRIGQEKNVFVYRLISKGTIEEKVNELKIKKTKLVDSILGDAETSFSGAITKEMIDQLFS